jgi:hypothetical protein
MQWYWDPRTLTKGVIYANSPSHPLLSLDRRKYLRRILESDWTFTQRVAYGEQIDEPARREWGQL